MTGEYYAVKENGSWRSIGEPADVEDDESLTTEKPKSDNV